MSSFPIPDILVFGVIVGCMVLSAMRGAISEIGSLVAWVVAFFAAKLLAVPFSDIAFASFQPRILAVALSFVSLFFIALLLQKFLRSLLSGTVSAVGLGFVNRILGAVFGVLKGLLIATVVVMEASKTDLPETEEWQSAYSVPYLQSLSENILTRIQNGSSASDEEVGDGSIE